MGNFRKVIAAFRKLDVAILPLTFQKRLIIQKTVYLLQLMGVTFGYDFTFNVRGVYSNELTEDMMALRAKYDAEKKED